jgi:hypothetical protein
VPLRGVATVIASRGMERFPMVIQRSRSLSASTLCAIGLCIACSKADTRNAQRALAQPALEADARLVSPPLVGAAAPAPSPLEGTSIVASSSEPPEVAAGDEQTGEVDGAAPGRAGHIPALNQLLTTQALLVSLLLTPLAKTPPEPPIQDQPAPPARRCGEIDG